MFDLNGKVVVVTGASSGLGASAALAYAEQGADVALLARRKEKLDSVATKIKAMGQRALTVECDVTNEEKVESAVQEVVNELGKIDILLNSAGIAVNGGVHTLSEKDWDRSMDTNVKSIFLMSKYIIPLMMEQEYGKIVNISSVNAIIADKDDRFIRHGYNSSKAAILGLTRGMACSYGRYNITVNTVGPGLFETEMTENTLFKSEKFMQGYTSQCPLDRPARRDELNGTILYFSSDASSYVTGQYVVVDGGTSLV